MRHSTTRALRRARAVIATSRFTAEAVRRAARLEGRAVHVLTPGVDGALIAADPTAGPIRERRVLAVARLRRDEAYKGVDTLILSWSLVLSRMPDAELVVVGDGDDRARLERLATRFGLKGRVQFRGHVDDSVLAECYASASIFALPGRARLGRRPEGEGFGLVFLEAATAGLPCVAGRAGGAVEAVEDGVTGLLVDPEQPRDVAGAITRLLGDAALASRMGAAGRERVAREFSYQRFRDRVAELVSTLVHE